MRSTLPVLVLVLATVPLARLSAQSGTRASTRTVQPCTAPAPAQSLRAARSEPAVFLPDAQGGFAVEIESAPAAGSWSAETTHAGFTGACYYRWTGPNLFSTTGQGVLTYRLLVPQAGRYRIALHNRHNHPDSSQENDCWIRANGSGWTKLYSNTGSNSNVWNFHSRFDPGHGYVEYSLSAGLNTIELSARSANFMIDRLHAFPTALTGYETTSVPISGRERSRPVLGRRFRAEAGDPGDTAGLTWGATAAFWMLSPIPSRSACGVIVPGFGPANAGGELLLDVSGGVVIVGPVTVGGPGSPARFSIDVPAMPGLVGSRLDTQALLFDAARLDPVLTDRLELRFGDV